jgi:hypothetical protein
MNIRMLTTEERERLAYIEGYTEAAELLGELVDARHQIEVTEIALFDAEEELSAREEQE